jgi:NAD-dependent deacetylase
MDRALIDKAAKILMNARHAVALTGAGISTESGVPDFRSPGGIWERYDPTIFFYERFIAQPDFVWQTLLDMHSTGGLNIWNAEPNRGHDALAWLEALGILKAVITQNIDNLHQKAGSEHVIEFHGNMLYVRCLDCSHLYRYDEILDEIGRHLPPRCRCGGVLKPDVIFFGEAIPSTALKQSFEEAETCDVMLVIGTSAQVEPAASLPLIAKGLKSIFLRFMHVDKPNKDCHIIEINREPTPLTQGVSDFILQGSAGEALQLITQRIQTLKGAAL